ncbi:MAG: 50S ribosomal protein L25 [Patescibacteria group bacterium]|mgnify:CR=1 FL=1
MDKLTLKADSRQILGRKIKSLRKNGILPANIYGRKVKSLAIQVNQNDFEEVFKKAGETGLIEIQIAKEKRPVLIHNIQKDPVSDAFIHADFFQVDLKEKVTATVTIEIVGNSPAEKSGVGTVVSQLNEIEVEALPADLPDKFTIDIGILADVGQAIYVKDLVYDKSKVEIKADLEQIVVKVEAPQKEEVVAPPPVEEVPVEAASSEEPGPEGTKEAEKKEEAEKSESGE